MTGSFTSYRSTTPHTMERKDFIASFFKPAATKKAVAKKSSVTITNELDEIVPITGSLAPYSGQWTDIEVMHLLKRLSFGAPVEEVNYFKTLTYTDAITQLFNTVNTPDIIGQPIKTYVNDLPNTPATDPDWSVPIGRTWGNTVTASNTVNRARRETVKSWWLNGMINQPSSIEEKMMLFWSSHVAVEFQTIGYAIMCYNYVQLLRQHALGNFKTLIKQITVSNAMLIYLNGYQSSKVAPDENYARELQELFTLGKGPDSQYTEDDVKVAARVLTGYQVNLVTGAVSFSLNRHDTNPKQFSSFYNNTIINRPPAQAEMEIDDLIDMIFSKEEVSKYICRRMYRYFVYHDITPEIESNIITPLAQTLRDNNYEMRPMLEQLFKSEHFFDVLQFGAMIKSPLDFLVGLIRETKVQLPPNANPLLRYNHLTYLAANYLPSIEQAIGEPINVAGFPAYYQTPFFDKLWITSDTFIKRKSLVDTLINSGYSNNGFKTSIDVLAVANRMSNPSNPNTLVSDFNKYFLRRELSQSLRDTIKTDILLTGQATDSYWTSAWNAYINDPADLNNYSVVSIRLKALAMFFLNKLEEYQLM